MTKRYLDFQAWLSNLKNLFFGFPEDDIKTIYDSCPQIWAEMETSEILVMGGTGFIGKWLIASLGYAQLAGHQINITVLSRNPRAHLGDFSNEAFQISWLENDVSKHSNLDVEKYKFIVNAATPSSAKTGAIHPSYVYDSIVCGNLSILQSAHHPELRYIFLSSGAVAVLEKSEPIINRKKCESHHLGDLSSAYSHGKRFAEIDISKARETIGLNAQALRLYAFAGPGLPMDQHFAVGNFMKNYLLAETIEIKGNPKTKRSYMYPTDLVIHILQSVISKETKTIEVGSTEVVSIGELATLIISDTNSLGFTNGDITQPITSYFPTSDSVLDQTIDLEGSLKKWKAWLNSFKH